MIGLCLLVSYSFILIAVNGIRFAQRTGAVLADAGVTLVLIWFLEGEEVNPVLVHSLRSAFSSRVWSNSPMFQFFASS